MPVRRLTCGWLRRRDWPCFCDQATGRASCTALDLDNLNTTTAKWGTLEDEKPNTRHPFAASTSVRLDEFHQPKHRPDGQQAPDTTGTMRCQLAMDSLTLRGKLSGAVGTTSPTSHNKHVQITAAGWQILRTRYLGSHGSV